jgi:hypothetical protein
MQPSCGQLVFSWVLWVGAVALMGGWGHVGFLLALPLMVGVQRVRGEHDREALQRYKRNSIYMGLALLYYGAVLVAAAAAMLRHRDLLDLNLGVLMVVILLPVMIGMGVADHAVCGARGGGK